MLFLRSLIVTLFLLTGALVQAAPSGGGFGFNFGFGVPFLSQAGLSYHFNSKLGVSLGYGLLDLKVGDAKTKLSMPEVLLVCHPFAGSFFLAAGAGQETLEATATDSTGTHTAKGKVEAMTTVAKLGWMWGISNGGFWFGMDISHIMPSGAKTTVTAPPGMSTNDPAYKDVVEAGEKFGKTAYTNITFARFGWIF